MMLTAFGQLQETATVIFFIKHGQPQPLRERTRRETLYSFLNKVHEQTTCASFIFTDLIFFPPDHSFFSSEWQKRWCVLNNQIFYYYGTDKGLYKMLTILIVTCL